MRLVSSLVIVVVFLAIGSAVYLSSVKNQKIDTPNILPSAKPTQATLKTVSPASSPDTKSAIQSVLADKYKKPLSEVQVTVGKEVQGFASGSVLFGQGGPGEGGMWLALLGNGWQVVWDGNGNVDCNKMRQQYGFPDTILKPNFCD